MKRKKIKFRAGHVITYIIIALFMVVYLVPLLYVFVTAFKTQQQFLKDSAALIFVPTFQSFINAWEKANVESYVLNSLIYSISSTGITLICALLIAFPIARRYIKGSTAIYTLFMMGMFLPDGTIPLFQMMLKAGLYNTRIGYILTTLAIGGVCMMFFTSYLRGLPKELDEAAIIDGIGYFGYFFRVIVPLSKPAISSMLILTAIGVWNEIARAIIFISDPKLFPITKGLFVFSGQYSTNWPELTAALILVAMPLVILYVFLQKQIVGGLTAGSVKM